MEDIRLELAHSPACETTEAMTIHKQAKFAPDAATEIRAIVSMTDPPNKRDGRIWRLPAADEVHAHETRVDAFSLADLERMIEQSRSIAVPQVQDLHACR